MIVATGTVPPIAEELLGVIVVAGPGELESLLPEAEVLIVRGGVFVTAETIAAAPRLRVIGRSGVGFSEVDVEAATRRGIPVVLAATAGAQAVAEGALALLLALAKRLPELDRMVKEGRWAERDSADVRGLQGATLGILGYGRIGRRLAALVEPFELRVRFHDPHVEGGVELETLFAESDLVSIHAPLTRGCSSARGRGCCSSTSRAARSRARRTTCSRRSSRAVSAASASTSSSPSRPTRRTRSSRTRACSARRTRSGGRRRPSKASSAR